MLHIQMNGNEKPEFPKWERYTIGVLTLLYVIRTIDALYYMVVYPTIGNALAALILCIGALLLTHMLNKFGEKYRW